MFDQQESMFVTITLPLCVLIMWVLCGFTLVEFLSGAVNMTEPQVKAAIAELVTQHIPSFDKETLVQTLKMRY